MAQVKFEIWREDYNEGVGRLVDVEDIVTAIDCSQNWICRFMPGTTEQQVMAAYAVVDHDEYDNLDEWLRDSNGLVADCPDYLKVSDESLCYESGFGFFQPCCCGADTFKMVEWWDGSNWVRSYAPDDVDGLEYDPDAETLIWDDGIVREFASVIDGMILVVYYSRYQGSYVNAEVLTPAEFATRCADDDCENPFEV